MNKATVFAIPLLVASISLGLSNHDLTNCIRVNKAWSTLFAIELYRRPLSDQWFIKNNINQTTTVGFWERSWPVSQDAREALTRHRSWIRVIQVQRLDCIRFLEEIQVSNLTQLVSTCYKVDPDEFEPLLNRNRRLKHVDLDCEVLYPRSFIRLMENGVARLDRLTFLKLTWAMESSFDKGNSVALVLSHLPPSLQDLDITSIDCRKSWITNSENKEDLREKEKWDGTLPVQTRDHRALKSLRLLLTLFYEPKDILQWFLSQCPNLLSLGLLTSRTIMTAHRALTDTLKAGSCTQLSKLAIAARDQDQSGVCACLDAFAPGQLKILSWTQRIVPVTERVWSSVKRHGPFLESLTMNVEKPESGTFRMVLTTFERLEHLVVNPFSDPEIMDLRHLRSVSTWACFRTLRKLSLQFQSNCELPLALEDFTAIDPSRMALYPKAHPDALRLYGQLSHLAQLESLLIGLKHRQTFASITNAGLVGFDFSMQSGLPILETLKQLKSLMFYQRSGIIDSWNRRQGDHGHGPLEPQIGSEEAQWMIHYWPSLTEIRQLGVERGPGIEVLRAREAAQVAASASKEIGARINAIKATLSEDEVKEVEVRAETERTLLELRVARQDALDAANRALAQAAEKAGDREIGPVMDWRLLETYLPERVHVWTG